MPASGVEIMNGDPHGDPYGDAHDDPLGDATPPAPRDRRSRAFERRVAEFMSRPAVFGDPELTVQAAAAAMTENGVGSLILLRGDGPSAIVTETDLVKALSFGVSPDDTWAIDVASDEVVAVSEEDTVAEAVDLMAEYGIHHLPVKRDGNVTGVVSSTDLLRALSYLSVDG